jgi:cold-inducible RNA-binding protein
MNKKLYVGNLPFDAEETALKDMFEAEGGPVVKVQVITDKMTGRSRGFGFVEFESAEDAQKAMNALNGRELGGRALVVNEAREQTRDGGGGGGGRGRGPGDRFGGGGHREGRGNRSSRW